MAFRMGLLGKKIGMTQMFRPDGQAVPVTLLKAGPCTVVQRYAGRPVLRALVHLMQFVVAYVSMLSVFYSTPSLGLTHGSLAMSFNGYIIISIFIGVFFGFAIFEWGWFDATYV